jgi:hypothetical protein
MSYQYIMSTIYVIQNAGLDITVRHTSLADYIEKQQATALASYLGWDYWLMGFQSLKHFKADPRGMKELEKGILWTLLVPKHEVKWCNPIALREGREPVWSWFKSSPEQIRKKGDFPLAFLKAPVQTAWVSKKGSAKDALIKAGLWQERGDA